MPATRKKTSKDPATKIYGLPGRRPASRVSPRTSNTRRQYRQARNVLAHQPEWLRPKLAFLQSQAENRDAFFKRIESIFPRTDPRYALIEKAYETAKSAFRRIKRDDETRYFEHLRATALIGIVHLRIRNANLIAALLLHDILEDVKSWNLERLRKEFNEEIASLVWWVSKPEPSATTKTKADIDRKYHRQLGEAPREAIMIKVCDRLHNLITLWSQKIDKIRDKVSETRNFILPLAEHHQLMIHELEDVLKLIEKRYGF